MAASCLRPHCCDISHDIHPEMSWLSRANSHNQYYLLRVSVPWSQPQFFRYYSCFNFMPISLLFKFLIPSLTWILQTIMFLRPSFPITCPRTPVTVGGIGVIYCWVTTKDIRIFKLTPAGLQNPVLYVAIVNRKRSNYPGFLFAE